MAGTGRPLTQARNRSATEQRLPHQVDDGEIRTAHRAGHADLAGAAGGVVTDTGPRRSLPDLARLEHGGTRRELGHEEPAVAGEAAALGPRRHDHGLAVGPRDA